MQDFLFYVLVFAGFTADFLRFSRKKQKILHRNAGFGVEHTGFEPVTSTMRM